MEKKIIWFTTEDIYKIKKKIKESVKKLKLKAYKILKDGTMSNLEKHVILY